jgi:hypothetical protein
MPPHLVRLQRQLARRGQDEAACARLGRVRGQLVHHGQHKRSRLAAAGARHANHIAALQVRQQQQQQPSQ